VRVDLTISREYAHVSSGSGQSVAGGSYDALYTCQNTDGSTHTWDFPSLGTSHPSYLNLLGLTFDDGGSAFGSFVFDATLDQYSSVDITITTGSSRSGAHYDTVIGESINTSSGGQRRSIRN
jgi:hypothetical protein